MSAPARLPAPFRGAEMVGENSWSPLYLPKMLGGPGALSKIGCGDISRGPGGLATVPQAPVGPVTPSIRQEWNMKINCSTKAQLWRW